MVQPTDSRKVSGTLRTSLSEPRAPIEDHGIARILASEEPSFDDIKTIMRGARYVDGYSEMFERE